MMPPFSGVDFSTFTTEKLIDAIIQLTHRIHGIRIGEEGAEERLRSLRAQRDMVRDEVLRRASS